MKYGMPRKIDDDRRLRLIMISVGLVLVSVVWWLGFEAWMSAYRERQARLGTILHEGKGFLERFDWNVRGQNPPGLDASLRYLKTMAGAGKGGGDIGKKANTLANYIGILIDEAPSAEVIASAKSELEASLAELEALEGLDRPPRDMAEAAEARFASAQAKAATIRAQVVEWRKAARKALEDAKAIEQQEMK